MQISLCSGQIPEATQLEQIQTCICIYQCLQGVESADAQGEPFKAVCHAYLMALVTGRAGLSSGLPHVDFFIAAGQFGGRKSDPALDIDWLADVFFLQSYQSANGNCHQCQPSFVCL